MELLVNDAKAAKANIKSAIRNWHQLEEILLYRFVFNVKSRFVDPDPHWFVSWTDSGLGMRIRIQEQRNLPVLRIQNVYSGSRIRFFPSFRIKSLNYQIGTFCIVHISNGNASETKASESFDNGVFFDIEAKRTSSIKRKLFSKRSEHIR